MKDSGSLASFGEAMEGPVVGFVNIGGSLGRWRRRSGRALGKLDSGQIRVACSGRNTDGSYVLAQVRAVPVSLPSSAAMHIFGKNTLTSDR